MLGARGEGSAVFIGTVEDTNLLELFRRDASMLTASWLKCPQAWMRRLIDITCNRTLTERCYSRSSLSLVDLHGGKVVSRVHVFLRTLRQVL